MSDEIKAAICLAAIVFIALTGMVTITYLNNQVRMECIKAGGNWTQDNCAVKP